MNFVISYCDATLPTLVDIVVAQSIELRLNLWIDFKVWIDSVGGSPGKGATIVFDVLRLATSRRP
jgi:hypothetical protein